MTQNSASERFRTTATLLAWLAPLLCSVGGCGRNTGEWISDLEDPDPFTRELAAAALGSASAEDAPLALQALRSVPPELREGFTPRLVQSIARISRENPSAFAQSIKSLPANEVQFPLIEAVLRASVSARVSLDADWARKTLDRLVESPSEELVTGIALLALGNADCMEFLASRLEDRRQRAVRIAAMSLKAAFEEGPPGGVLDRFVEATRSDEPENRVLAVLSRARADLNKRASPSKPAVSDVALDDPFLRPAVRETIAALADSSPRVRWAASLALGQLLKATGAVPIALRTSATSDPSLLVRGFAQAAILGIEAVPQRR